MIIPENGDPVFLREGSDYVSEASRTFGDAKVFAGYINPTFFRMFEDKEISLTTPDKINSVIAVCRSA